MNRATLDENGKTTGTMAVADKPTINCLYITP